VPKAGDGVSVYVWCANCSGQLDWTRYCRGIRRCLFSVNGDNGAASAAVKFIRVALASAMFRELAVAALLPRFVRSLSVFSVLWTSLQSLESPTPPPEMRVLWGPGYGTCSSFCMSVITACRLCCFPVFINVSASVRETLISFLSLLVVQNHYFGAISPGCGKK